MSKEIAVIENNKSVGVFAGEQAFETAQRMAKALASSQLVPKEYQGNLANCLVALEVAQRTGSSVMAVAQNLHIIHGRPSWSAQYIIAALNSCGRFAPIRFDMKGEGMKRSCIAWTVDKSGERLEGPEVSIDMAKAEGWFEKSGSKWKTMPDLMLRYRSAAFFGRLYAPDILMGMQTDDEIRDVTPASQPVEGIKTVNEKIKTRKAQAVVSETSSDKETTVRKDSVVDAEIIDVTSDGAQSENKKEETKNEGEFF